MDARLYRRARRSLTGLVVGAFVAGGLWGAPLATARPASAAQADVPPQEPGVTLRVFDVQVPLEKICTLKPGQTPNVDKLMPAVDWSTTDDFGGFNDNFVTQVTGNVHAPANGSYTFRLSSDDGSRLLIDGQVVIDHDGLHGAEPKDGTVQLTEGMHSLRIDHFERGGDQVLNLAWRPPGAEGFATVPNSALSTDAGVVRVTAPGRKECEGFRDSPGDGLPLNSVRPDLTLTDLRPEGFEPQVTGMDWLPDGRLVVSTWGGTDNTAGEVYVMDEVTGSTGPDKVRATKIAEGLKEPMGLKVVDGTIFVSQKHELTELGDSDGDGVMDEFRTIATWPYGGNFHEFAFGLLYSKGYFYLNLSVAINYGGATTDPQPAPGRGATIKVNKKTGKVSYLAGGLRTPNGIGWGPEGDIFATDNQGGWLPSSKLVHIKQDRFFNHYTNPAGPFDSEPVTQPVLWLPQNEIANSPSTPLYLTKGRFKGQMLFGDVTYGGLQRAYLEKVKGQYQGAVFRYTQGLEAGVNRITMGPDGAIYAGGLGADGNWGQEGKLRYGLQKLTPNGGDTFDIQAMRVKKGGFELEYTQPLSEETADNLVSHYEAQQWRYTPTQDYGGPKIAEETLKVTSAKLSRDRKKVTLAVEGLKPGRVVHLRSPRPFSSASGETLWSTEAWYTLNAMPGKQPEQGPLYEAEEAALTGAAGINTDHRAYSGSGFVARYGTRGATTTFDVKVRRSGTYDVGLRYSNGPNPFQGTKSLSLYVNGEKVKQAEFRSTGDWDTWSTQTEALRLRAGHNSIAYRYDEGDTGHVNLDLLSVDRHGGAVELFDGDGTDRWQHTDGRPVEWPVTDGAMEVCCGDIRTKNSYDDFRLHVEYWLPQLPPDVTGQDRANSGVYLQDRYELQILDSYGDTTPDTNEAGAIYLKKAPDVNAARAPETWQSYDIVFHAARYDAEGEKTADARVTVVWNGKKVHDDVSINSPTGGGAAEGPAAGAIRLQDHGNKVRYRNIRIEPLR
ncbi:MULTISPECIES: family 16 glycoside hydrolase [Streptomyces]|uniref:Family 16 glycoside hydrolase n=1 Tax=Streptomyces edwardsiae TaxID=3075527 RepID=A0ABU2QGC2_9ACTN|nr:MULTISPECIES: family 16 glycoside hydrolase [unclassified Streptomyces]MDT0403450.1 family 16 glycoside hydrolase [Streptomyces sp. DSM 41635]